MQYKSPLLSKKLFGKNGTHGILAKWFPCTTVLSRLRQYRRGARCTIPISYRPAQHVPETGTYEEVSCRRQVVPLKLSPLAVWKSAGFFLSRGSARAKDS